MKKRNKGFTLIELLAVIVILGLLMAIAIPSVTKYINQSKKKTLSSTIDNYVGALVTEVNDGEYNFTSTSIIYAVPIECISLEKGGTSPFGDWLHANDNYWAYVLVQPNDESYTYGFTFKDSASYGLYPTVLDKVEPSNIKTGLSLTKPTTGKVTNITAVNNWNGFDVDGDTDLVVLVAESEGVSGDGETTCTLQQKGDNYEQVEKSKSKLLTKLIKTHNTLITAAPTLTTSSNNSSDASGLYSSTATTNGEATYYFRGNVTNNNVEFAGLKWKIIRINEDGTIRLILDDRIGDTTHQFNMKNNTYQWMYYSNTPNARPQVNNWYKTNIGNNEEYDKYVVNGIFCEQAKVKGSSSNTSGDATMDTYKAYTPNFDCDTDGNGKGIVKNEDGTLVKAGLITYDEVVHAGGYYGNTNSKYYLYNGSYEIWTMSPAGFKSQAYVWFIYDTGKLNSSLVHYKYSLRPVINLATDVLATGSGTSDDPYVIQTN